jgi:hypothetical protein
MPTLRRRRDAHTLSRQRFQLSDRLHADQSGRILHSTRCDGNEPAEPSQRADDVYAMAVRRTPWRRRVWPVAGRLEKYRKVARTGRQPVSDSA